MKVVKGEAARAKVDALMRRKAPVIYMASHADVGLALWAVYVMDKKGLACLAPEDGNLWAAKTTSALKKTFCEAMCSDPAKAVAELTWVLL